MTVIDIVAGLKECGVFPRVEGGQLKLSGETNKLSADFIAEIRARKNELITFLNQINSSSSATQIPLVSKSDVYPVSHSQRRVWILSQFSGGKGAYNIVTHLSAKGILVVSTLQQAFNAVIARHESLRTVFVEIGGEPFQEILDNPGFEVELVDLTSPRANGRTIDDVIKSLNHWEFDLQTGPLIKVVVAKCSPDEYVLSFCVHHIISDGWSIGNLVKEVMYFYERFSTGKIPTLGDLKVQYKDYRSWIEDRIGSSYGNDAAQFWRERLSDFLEPLHLPADFSRPEVRSFDGSCCRFYLDLKLNDDVSLFCRQHGVTPFNFYQACLYILIYKLTGQHKIVIGTPVSGRNHIDLENQIGLYVNTIPLCANVEPGLDFVSFLRETAQQSFNAFEYQEYPFDKIVEDLNVGRDTSRNPLFDVMLVYQNTAISDGSMDINHQHNFYLGAYRNERQIINGVEVDIRSAKADLNFNFDRNADGNSFLEIEYATTLFTFDSITRIYEMYLQIVREVLCGDNPVIGRIEIITEQEKKRILTEFNAPMEDIGQETLWGYFCNFFEKFSDRVAVTCEERQLTFDDVNRFSRQIASRLSAVKGTAAHPFVGLMIQRSEHLLPAILGVFRSGSAYVPIDTKYPQERINFLIEDAGLEILVVDDSSADLIPADYTGHLINLAELIRPTIDDVSIMGEGSEDIEAIAYLIYTSGSTGKPKGVQISGRNLLAFLKWASIHFQATPFETLYATTSLCFDLSVFELLFPLTQGKNVRILGNGLDVGKFVTRDANVFINTVPSVVRSLIDDGMNWSNVAALNMAGEVIPAVVANELLRYDFEIRNLYGPSEDTTYSTVYRFDKKEYLDVPIGVPVGYTNLYILDENLQLAPIGVDGEIHLSGHSVASGYLGRPELTASRFIDNPFIPGLKMYKTGDIGKWSVDGNVIYIGRKDDQCKLRGHRIELGEIQYAIELLPAVQKAVVLIRDVAGEKAIVAYWVGEGEGAVQHELAQQLTQKLPFYMQPSFWVKLEEIPLNSNGKVDRSRLPQPSASDVPDAADSGEMSPLEQKVEAIWSTVLKREHLGVHSNFFLSGGHSLMAIKVRSLIQAELGIDVSLEDIFRFPTISQLASIIDGKQAVSFERIPEAIPAVNYPISLMQQRLWVSTKFDNMSRAYNMPACFEVSGNLDLELLRKSFEMLIRRHESLRTVFAEIEGNPVQVIVDFEKFDFRIGEIKIAGGQSEMLSTIESVLGTGFDLANGPLLRCVLITSGESCLLCISMHHLISDGWSIKILAEELTSNYRDLRAGAAFRLSDPGIQYHDFSVWQRNRLAEESENLTEGFWYSKFPLGFPAMEVPSDHPRPNFKTYNGRTASFDVSPSLSQSIRELAIKRAVTPFSLLISVFTLLIRKYVNQDYIVMGTPTPGRNMPQLQELIGCFVDTVPFATLVDPNLSFSVFLDQQQQNVLEILDNKDLSLELLLEQHNGRDISRSSLFDIVFVYQEDDSISKFDFDDFSLRSVEIPSDTAKYDLTFNVTEKQSGYVHRIEFNTDLYHDNTIAKLHTYFTRILEVVTANPDIIIKDIDIISGGERKELIDKFDRVSVSYDKKLTINSLFDIAVASHRGNTALRCEGREFTYDELDSYSSLIASFLIRDCGVGTGEPVVLCSERSEWIVIGILAILRAGAAYVPLDSSIPRSRMEFIVRDTQARVFLSDFDFDPSTLDTDADVRFWNLTKLDLKQDIVPLPTVTGDSLAYVIFTSGTTGTPKGVLIEHGHVARLFFNDENPFRFDSTDVWCLFHSFAFDFSVWEIFGALLYGGTLAIVPKEVAQNSLAFYDFLGRNRVTVLNQTPTAFRSLVNVNAGRLDSGELAVRYLIFGGEMLQPRLVESWKRAYPACQIVNMYGITETTVHVTYKLITDQDVEANKSNVGHPLPTLSCFVLDNDLKLAIPGTIGELFVGGAGVARGYLNREQLNNERFLTDFIGQSGRLYRSGDYARILPSDELEYIGRRDSQVKIRGHRIEVSEIEAALCQIPGIRDAVVTTVLTESGDHELAAYYIGDVVAGHAEIRGKLGPLVPAYMIPSYIVALESFPLNSNGKLDKSRLPSILEIESQSTVVPPRNELDQALIAIWEQVLAKSGIGITDNFFDLGGHSLKATKMISRISEVFGIQVDLKSLFIDPTIMNLSDYIETMIWMNTGQNVTVTGEDEVIF